VGFEPTVPLVSGTLDFESSAFDQLSHLSGSEMIKNINSQRLNYPLDLLIFYIISSSISQASFTYFAHFSLNRFFSFAIR
jgi:hypothetical protein